MDGPQNLTNEISEIDKAVNIASPKPLSPEQQMWIDFKAIGGRITEQDTLLPEKMTVTKFASLVKVSRETLYEWTRTIPDFWGKVAARRKELGNQERLVKVHDTWYLKAIGGSFPHMQLWLANFDPDFRMPTEKIEHELGDSWAALARSKKLIEGEVSDTQPTEDKPS